MEILLKDLTSDIPNLFVFFLPLYFLLIGIEMYISYKENRDIYEKRDSIAGILVAAVATILNTLTKAWHITFFYFFFKLAEPLRMEYLGYSHLDWTWWAWAICLVGDDFNFYWHHRFCHTIRLFWAAHIVHHSSEKFNFLVAFRNGWTIFLYKPIYWIWLPLLGFNPLMVALCMTINSIYQFFLHSVYVPRIPGYGAIFNTPWDHQVHHSSNTQYLDKNHGGILIIWDKIFGTYQAQIPGVDPRFGVLHPPGSYNPFTLNFHEFGAIWQDVKKAKGLRAKWGHVFAPPGWDPNGNGTTAKELQAELAAKNSQSDENQAALIA